MWNAYLAMGDSITTGFGNWRSPSGSRSWTDFVAQALVVAQPGLRYRNVAHNGATASALIDRQLPALSEFHPDLVSVTVGANDARSYDWSADRFARELDRILGAIVAHDAQPLTVTYPDITVALAAAGRESAERWRPALERLRAVNSVIRKVGAPYGALLLDLEESDAASDLRYLSIDLTHPSAEGYRLAADAAVALLATSGGRIESDAVV